MLTDAQQRTAAKKFAAEWKTAATKRAKRTFSGPRFCVISSASSNRNLLFPYETQVLLGHTSFIDANIPETRVMIELKSLDIDLNKPAKQS